MQWIDKSYDDLVSLYRLLVNPSLSATYRILKQRHRSVRVVIYTMRADFLFYHSICSPAIIPIRWRPEWHHDGQLYFPPDAGSAEQILESCRHEGLAHLEAEDLHGLSKSLERLLVARHVVAEVLGLPAPPDLVVTAGEKDVDRTARRLGCRPDAAAFLWDDNPALRDRPRVVPVPPFDRLPSDQHRRLTEFLQRHLPPDRIPTELVDFLLTANPRDCLLHPQPAAHGRLAYSIPSAEIPSEEYRPWPVPPGPPVGAELGGAPEAAARPGPPRPKPCGPRAATCPLPA